jgi:hypothetical protein
MQPRSIILISLIAAVAAGLVARAFVPSLSDQGSSVEIDAWLEGLDLQTTVVLDEPTRLAYVPPTDCVEVYAVTVTEQMADEVARFYNRRPEVSDAVLSIGRHERPQAGTDPDGRVVTRVLTNMNSDDIGVRPHASTEPTPMNQRRDAFSSARGLGPAAPDAACRNRSWDPIEDALALGWPWLDPRKLQVGDSWTGARVEGRCNETACLTADGVAGPKAHERACVTASWNERLVALVDVGWHRFAAVESTWRDREDLEEIEGGTLTTRSALISTDSGRLARARVVVEHRWSGIRREVRIDSIDACPGSLAAAGWARPDHLVAQAERAANPQPRRTGTN